MSLRVFITGATGFVGSHLIQSLKSPEYLIYGTSYPEKPKSESGKHGEKISYLDIRSQRDVFEVVRETQPDWIFHLAAVSNVKHSWERRQETLETNLMGFFYLLEAARQCVPEAKTLFVSSSDVYGVLTPQEKPLREDDPLQPVNPYAFTKISGELLSQFYSRIERMNIVIARSFPHTGPGQSPDFVCSDWAHQVARIESRQQPPLIRVGNCKVRRDFTDVRDVVRAYILLMKKGKGGDVYNVSSGQAAKLEEILNLLLSFSKERIKVEVDSQKVRRVDIPLLVGDNQKIREETSWEPMIPLEQSLQDLLEYWRGNL